MDLDYSNDMINSSTGRMTTEHWVKHFGIQSWHNVGKSGRDFLKWVWQAVYIFHGKLFSS